MLSGQLKLTSGQCWTASEVSVRVFCPLLFRLFVFLLSSFGASQVVPVVKNPPANAKEVRDTGSIPGSGRSPGGGHSNPFQYSYLENPMDRGAWQAVVHRITKDLDMTEVT